MLLKQPFLCLLCHSISALHTYLTLSKMAFTAPKGVLLWEMLKKSVLKLVHGGVDMWQAKLLVFLCIGCILLQACTHLLYHKSFHWLSGRLFLINIIHSHTHHAYKVAPELYISRALKQNRNMATSALSRLWTSSAFAFQTSMKKASKTTLPLFKGDSGLHRQSLWKWNLKCVPGY